MHSARHLPDDGRRTCYYTPRLVGSERAAGKVRQRTLLNLGARFALERAQMAAPGSEQASYRWLQAESGLGELIDFDYETMGAMALYRASDCLYRHREALESQLFERIRDLFEFESIITLYDLTNTFFEGAAAGNPDTQRGHSKEKRMECPLLTLGMVLDGSGFPRDSRVRVRIPVNVNGHSGGGERRYFLTHHESRFIPWVFMISQFHEDASALIRL